MRHHLIIWSFTLAVLVLAATLVVMRAAILHNAAPDASPEAQITETLELLKHDPSAAEAETQAAVRSAAVLTESGLVRSAEGAFLLALQLEREQNLRGAEAFFKRAIALRPDWNLPYDGLGRLLGLHTLNRTEEAKQALRKSIALDPTWGQPHITLAVLLRLEGRLDEAEKEALEALRLDPDSVPSRNNYANLLVRRGAFDEAEIQYRKAIELNPQRPKPYYNLACLFSLTGRRQDALGQLEKVFNMEPLFRAEALGDPDLAPLWEDPDFKQLVFGSDEETARQYSRQRGE